MNQATSILLKSLVKPFYKENAGSFVFVFTMLFFIIGVVDGAGVLAYHYSLIMGILKSPAILMMAFIFWLIYARKYAAFVSSRIKNSEYQFLQLFNSMDRKLRMGYLILVETMLLLPVLLYAVFVIIIGIRQHLYSPVIIVIGYLILLLIVPAIEHILLLENPSKKPAWYSAMATAIGFSYPGILIRFAITRQKMLWAGLKVFTCGLLYLMLRNIRAGSLDTNSIYLFFNFGILAHGVLIFRMREFENFYLGFYRGMPVSVVNRFAQYALVYFIVLLPEWITLGFLTPAHISLFDGFNFGLGAFASLMLMNGIALLGDFRRNEFLKISLLLLGMQYFLLMGGGLSVLWIMTMIAAIVIFVLGYFRFEKAL